MKLPDTVLIKYLLKNYLFVIVPTYLGLHLVNYLMFPLNTGKFAVTCFFLVTFNQIGIVTGLFSILNLSSKKHIQILAYTNIISFILLVVILLIESIVGISQIPFYKSIIIYTVLLAVGNYISFSALSHFGIIFNIPIGTIGLFFILYNILYVFFTWHYIFVAIILYSLTNYKKAIRFLYNSSKYFLVDKDSVKLNNMENDRS